ncbi:MAG TPA: hypothetical protein VK892_13205, partial [Pyrinomonadaceae bacterium]|nr:hypothetical protein [Pyrinomonadaceae bacterium]
MRFFLKTLALVLLICSFIYSQEMPREQKLQKIDELNNQIKSLETDFLLPDATDLTRAKEEGFSVFRIMPRERFDGKFTIQGGGSYYSFTNKTH